MVYVSTYVTKALVTVELYLNTLLTSILDECVWSALRSDRFIRGQTALCLQIVGLDALERRKIYFACREPNQPLTYLEYPRARVCV
jgi:hypothetical protein